MGVDNFINTSSTGNRKNKRARVLLACKLQTPYGEIEGRLRDLSRMGALIECSPSPPMDTEVVFLRGKIAVPARIAWSESGRVGIEFLYMIDESEVLVHMKRVATTNEQRFRRPGIREEASERERKLAAAWGVQVGINLPDPDN